MGNASALGNGAVSLQGGALDLDGKAAANTINIAARKSGVIENGANFAGTVKLNGGTLTLEDTLGGTLVLNGGVLDVSAQASPRFGTLKTSALTEINVGNVVGLAADSHTLLTFTDGTGIDTTLLQIAGVDGIEGMEKTLETGTGNLTIATENPDWKGDIKIGGGTVIIGTDTALGKGSVSLIGGSLDMGGRAIANTITVTSSATIKGGAKYKGRLTLTKGTLSGDKINIASGKNAYLKTGTVKNALGGTGAVYKQGSGTVTLAGANNWTGNTYVQGGKLTIAKAGGKKGSTELEPQDDFIQVISAPETYTASPSTLGQATWGTARAARLFDHTVRDHAQAQSVALDKTRSVWFAGMSGFSHVDDAADTNIYGGAVGMQFNGSMGGNAGIAIGQTYGHVSPAGATRVKQQTQHAALYGTKMLYTSASDSVSLTGTASYGTTDSDHETLDWTQHSAVLGVRGTWEHKVGKSTGFYSFAGLEYLATDSESGSGFIQALQGSIGAGISHTSGRLTLHADASFTPDMVRNNPYTSTVNPGRLGFEVGAGATYRLSDQWSLNAGYTYHNEKRSDSHEAYIGARCTF